MTPRPFLPALALAAALVGCAGEAPEAPPADLDGAPPAPAPLSPEAPSADDETVALEAALREALGADAGEVRYFAGRADLNVDGRPEVVVHVAGPLLCGTGGCPTLVFTPEGDGLRLVSEMTVSRPPVVAAREQTKGWRDLVVGVGGGGAGAGLARLRFDGEAYPSNPTVTPAAPAGTVEGDTLVAPYGSFADGTLLPDA